MSGNKIDVYLQPLVKELNELWIEGVETYDSFSNKVFVMRTSLMWTFSDFPGLCTLSGWNTYTCYACPTSNFDVFPCRLRRSNKWCFMGHRRFLERSHKFRLMKKQFDGTIEERGATKLLSGLEILKQLHAITFDRNLESSSRGNQWRRKSIFFNLPYWKENLLHRNLDVMHIEKNVCDNVLYTMLKDEKLKDHLQTRQDLKDMGIKEDLWPNEKWKIHSFVIYNDKRIKKDIPQYIKECEDVRWLFK